MIRKIKLTRNFSKSIDDLLRKRRLLQKDFDNFVRQLAEHPEIGAIIPGTSGVRKIRLKSASKGKRGSFRICYYFLAADNEIYLIQIYAKNVQEDITVQEKKNLKLLTKLLKEPQ